jgi:hypothetical protein
MSVYRIRSSVEDRFTRHLIVIQGTFEKSRGKGTNVLMAGPTRVEVSPVREFASSFSRCSRVTQHFGRSARLPVAL